MLSLQAQMLGVSLKFDGSSKGDHLVLIDLVRTQ